jgi:hypothetical protein
MVLNSMAMMLTEGVSARRKAYLKKNIFFREVSPRWYRNP